MTVAAAVVGGRTGGTSNSAALAVTGSAPAHIGDQPRQLDDRPFCTSASALARMRYLSPLRYPGAKAGLAPVIARWIETAASVVGKPSLFVEPFCGGAATSLRLATAGTVDRIILADVDPRVARFWQIAASDTEWLIDRMYEEPVTLERWDYWRAWTPRSASDRETAMKCLFLNRTTFSGILHGRAGPIGGRAQTGPYPIGCRFNKEALERRLRVIGGLYEQHRLVDVWCKDWEACLRDVSRYYPEVNPDRVTVYLDPPYLRKSDRLYGRSFDPAGGYAAKLSGDSPGWKPQGTEHRRLAEYVLRRLAYWWILSYDHVPELTSDLSLYAACQTSPGTEDVPSRSITKSLVNLHYSASGSAGRGGRTELLLSTLPVEYGDLDPLLRRLD